MKIGLALSGGGAIGAAHFGILEILDQEKIEISAISGTSAGAIIGLLYAEGGLSLVKEFFEDIDKAGITNLAKIIIRRNDKIFETIEKILRQKISAKSFSELKKKFVCVATDIDTGKPKYFSTGDPVDAVMASASYPGFFSIRKIGYGNYVDGGLVKNLPATILKSFDADFIIGSSLLAVSKLENVSNSNSLKLNPFSTAIRAIDIMSKVIADYEIKECDFCFEPPVESYHWFDFHKIEEIHQLGREYAESKIFFLKKKIQIREAAKAVNTGEKSWWSIFSRK